MINTFCGKGKKLKISLNEKAGLCEAVRAGQLEPIKHILKRWPKIYNVFNDKPLFDAIQRDNIDIKLFLIKCYPRSSTMYKKHYGAIYREAGKAPESPKEKKKFTEYLTVEHIKSRLSTISIEELTMMKTAIDEILASKV
jgi:hypothetical protein